MVLKEKQFDFEGVHYKISQKNFIDSADIRDQFLEANGVDKDAIAKMKRSLSSKLLLKTYLVEPIPTDELMKSMSESELGKIITEINIMNGEKEGVGEKKDF